MRTYNIVTGFKPQGMPTTTSNPYYKGSESFERRLASLVSFLSKYDLKPSPSENRTSKKLLNKFRKAEVRQQLKNAGLHNFELHRRECSTLHRYLHKTEQVCAAIGGYNSNGAYVVLAATTYRIIYLKQQPLFTTLDEIAYENVGAITLSTSRWYATVTLHARTGEYRLQFVNHTAANRFADYVEKKSIDSTVTQTATQPQNA